MGLLDLIIGTILEVVKVVIKSEQNTLDFYDAVRKAQSGDQESVMQII